MTQLTRRTLLIGSAGAAAWARKRTAMARVKVAPERVIRAIVGLRPFRPSGFVVRGEKLDGKIVIHNYGHGGGDYALVGNGTGRGGGLQVGSARMCCDRLRCSGLSTARLLQLRGYSP